MNTVPPEKNDEITIDLTELLRYLGKHAHLIILAGIFCALLAFVGTSLFVTPQYTSTTKMYVLTKQGNDSSVTYSDIQTGTQLTKDYIELAKSRSVLQEVIDKLQLDESVESLSGKVTAATPENTRILSISVEDQDPIVAKNVANTLRDAVSVQIKSIMEAESVNTVEEANLPTETSSPSLKKNLAIGGGIGIIIALGILLILFIKDDTIKTPEDVERLVGLNVLTSIPNAETDTKKSKKAKMTSKQYKKTLQRK